MRDDLSPTSPQKQEQTCRVNLANTLLRESNKFGQSICHVEDILTAHASFHPRLSLPGYESVAKAACWSSDYPNLLHVCFVMFRGFFDQSLDIYSCTNSSRQLPQNTKRRSCCLYNVQCIDEVGQTSLSCVTSGQCVMHIGVRIANAPGTLNLPPPPPYPIRPVYPSPAAWANTTMGCINCFRAYSGTLSVSRTSQG